MMSVGESPLKAGVLWVCTSASGGRNGAPYVGETALKAFNLKDASFKASYAFPGNGLCNDIAVAKDGTVYVASRRPLRVGEIATVKIERADDYDLHGTAVGF